MRHVRTLRDLPSKGIAIVMKAHRPSCVAAPAIGVLAAFMLAVSMWGFGSRAQAQEAAESRQTAHPTDVAMV